MFMGLCQNGCVLVGVYGEMVILLGKHYPYGVGKMIEFTLNDHLLK